MFEGFTDASRQTDDVRIHAIQGGKGPPLLLLHGHPQTHVIWHKVAPRLAEHFTVVAADLRGYGDSGKPDADPEHVNYSKRRMALDQVALMRGLGFNRFRVLAHDRGARVAARMALDHPDCVEKLITLDIAPTLSMYEQTTFTFARAYWHWFFLINPAPFPETLIRVDVELYLHNTMVRFHSGVSPFTPEAYAEYLRCAKDPRSATAICEDYRASATIDLDHDRLTLQQGEKMPCPLLALWGEHGMIGRCFDPLKEWRKFATHVSGQAVASGHYIPEEAPDELLELALPFLLA